MLNTMHLRTVLRQEASSAETAPGATDTGGDSGESSFFDQIRNADDSLANPQRKATADPAAPEKPAKKPDPKPAATTEKPVKKADKLAEVTEEAEPEEPGSGEAEDELPPEGKKEGEEGEKQMSRWNKLRAEEKRAKQLDKTVEILKKEMEELRKNPISKEVQAELERHREREAIFEVERTKEYRENVTSKLAKAEGNITEICTEFKLDPDKMFEAMREIKEYKRQMLIDKIIDDADSVPAAIKSALYKEADRLHEGWLKGSEMKSKAAQLKAAYDAKAEKATTEQTYEQQQAWQKAVAASRSVMEKKIAPIIKAMPEDERQAFFDSLDSAQISDDPEERAMQAHGLEVAAVVTKALIAQRKELAEARRTIASLTNARPGTKQVNTNENENPNEATDDDDFFAKVRQAEDYRRR